MKLAFIATDYRGRFLCYQVADTEENAVAYAKMYGHNSAKHATRT